MTHTRPQYKPEKAEKEIRKMKRLNRINRKIKARKGSVEKQVQDFVVNQKGVRVRKIPQVDPAKQGRIPYDAKL